MFIYPSPPRKHRFWFANQKPKTCPKKFANLQKLWTRKGFSNQPFSPTSSFRRLVQPRNIKPTAALHCCRVAPSSPSAVPRRRRISPHPSGPVGQGRHRGMGWESSLFRCFLVSLLIGGGIGDESNHPKWRGFFTTYIYIYIHI